MKPVKVEYRGRLEAEQYGHTDVRFAFCSKIEKDRTVRQVTHFVACREEVTKHFRGRATNKAFKHVDTKRLRMLTYLRTPFDCSPKTLTKARDLATKKMEAAVKLLNHFEERAGWALTKLYPTDNAEKFIPVTPRYGWPDGGDHIKDKEPYIHIYMVVSSNKWLKSSHYISLYLLMLRIGNDGFKGTFKSHKQLIEKEMPALIAKRSNNTAYLKSTYKKWDIFIKNQRELLKGRTALKSSFSLSRLSHGHNSGYNEEGIERLVAGKTFDMGLADRWYTLCKKHEIHQKPNVERERK